MIQNKSVFVTMSRADNSIELDFVHLLHMANDIWLWAGLVLMVTGQMTSNLFEAVLS
jgi:hypothetical protein